MASITIRNWDDDYKQRLRVRAAKNGRSMEAEARQILSAALDGPDGEVNAEPPKRNLAKEIQALYAPLGGLELPEAERQSMREPPAFLNDHGE